MSGKYDPLVERYLTAETVHRIAARMILLALQEDAIDPLADAYFAGVNDEQGLAILDLMTEIGGYEALNIMRDIVKHETQRPNLRIAAAEGLLYNQDNLSKNEVKAIKRFLSQYAADSE